MTATGHAPEQTISRFSALLAEGDLEALLELYEPQAAFVARPGHTVCGRDAIRASLQQFLALEPCMTGEIVRVLTAGDTALVANRWSLVGSQPDGAPVEMKGVSADVLRKRPDGSWGILIDDPWGGN